MEYEQINDYNDYDDYNDATEYDIELHIENQISLFDDYIDYLWENVMLKYIDSLDNVVLNKLSSFDKHKFRGFMLRQLQKTHQTNLKECT